jgi:hypothetical protein
MESYLFFADDTDEFIRLVHQRRALWDREDLEHHSLNTPNKLWKEVGQELKTTRYAVRAKWKALRDGFVTRFRKMPVRPSGDGGLEFYYTPLLSEGPVQTKASSLDIPPEEKWTLRDDQTDTRDGEFETAQCGGFGK